MHRWTEEELAWVRAHLHLTKKAMAELIGERFGFECTKNMIKGVFTRHGITCGRTGRFEPGLVPFNKGRKGVNGPSPTSFQPGNLPHNWVPVGSERNNSGIVEVKVADPNSWRSKHALIWEAHHGRPVPEGHVVIFADLDRHNFAADNLLLVSRAELAVMNKSRLITTHAEATLVGYTVARVIMARKRRGKEGRV